MNNVSRTLSPVGLTPGIAGTVINLLRQIPEMMRTEPGLPPGSFLRVLLTVEETFNQVPKDDALNEE